MKTFSILIKEIIFEYQKQNDLIADPVRGGERVEIPAGFALAILKHNLKEYFDFSQGLLDLIIQKQELTGSWLEFPYQKQDLMKGFSGAIPTCFAIFALVEGYKKFDKEEYFKSARRGAHYLYQNEKNGYFIKAALNKSDVINTNLMAGLALLKVSEILPDNASEINLYKFVANRALCRSVSSQLFSGAFPYISFGFKVPFLYHAMSLALVGFYNQYLKKEIICYSFKKGLKYLNKINKQGEFNWKKANDKDKQGAVWAYAWAAVCFNLGNREEKFNLMIEKLERAKKEKFLAQGDFDDREDLFYTAWSLLALSLINNEKIDVLKKISLKSKVKFYLLILSTIPKRLQYIFKIFIRRYFNLFIDKGPVEEY